ncbi:MAG TPA: YdiU family protein [Gammaproteobacteria bacterium]|nr:YdiU family protein [Gammaproteobacteria bacterium]
MPAEPLRCLEDLALGAGYRELPGGFYRPVTPEPLPGAHLVSFNPEAARLLDLDPAEAGRGEFAQYFAGNRPFPGADPIALCYAGHQFGVWVPQLGDGRAILVGQVCNRRGERWDVQLKGAGRTDFSRGGDGRAVLRSTIREYLCSEAMHGLGIPTTRALCIIGSDLTVFREAPEPGAVMTRLAPSHVRFGTFECFAHMGRADLVRALADHVIALHFPELQGRADGYARFFSRVVELTATLMAQWQSVGFAHGVMNTDNMSILGLTIDYGPFGFMDDYDSGLVCNHSDFRGRYAFDQQPKMGLWNLVCLGEALLCLISEREARDALDGYESRFADQFLSRMADKLGLTVAQAEDEALISDLLSLLQAHRVDYTNFFRALGDFSTASEHDGPVGDLFPNRAAFLPWAQRYRHRLRSEGSDDARRRKAMNRTNPKFVLRNYLAHDAIVRAVRERDYRQVDRLLQLLIRPFDEHPGMEAYAEPPPDWGRRLAVSCSS